MWISNLHQSNRGGRGFAFALRKASQSDTPLASIQRECTRNDKGDEEHEGPWLEADNPDQRFEAEDAGVRSGGHRGTTWHSWNGPDWSCMISSVMAKAQAKHKCQLTHEDKAELEVNEYMARGEGLSIAERRWGPPPPQAEEGRSGGYSGKIGGRGFT